MSLSLYAHITVLFTKFDSARLPTSWKGKNFVATVASRIETILYHTHVIFLKIFLPIVWINIGFFRLWRWLFLWKFLSRWRWMPSFPNLWLSRVFHFYYFKIYVQICFRNSFRNIYLTCCSIHLGHLCCIHLRHLCLIIVC
jgi:hypothetical protein